MNKKLIAVRVLSNRTITSNNSQNHTYKRLHLKNNIIINLRKNKS